MSIKFMTFITAAATTLIVTLAAAPASAATCAEEMSVVKAEWDKAPAGAQKDAALTYYTNAGTAEAANDEATCLADLNAATTVLTMVPMTADAGTMCAEQLVKTKAVWDEAEAGPKKDAALVHYTAAVASDEAKNEAICMVHAEAASASLM